MSLTDMVIQWNTHILDKQHIFYNHFETLWKPHGTSAEDLLTSKTILLYVARGADLSSPDTSVGWVLVLSETC